MNIDHLTYGQLKAIATMFATSAATVTVTNPCIGKFCIVRAEAAGVHAGTVVAVSGDTVTLKDSRRLWSWTAKEGVALSGVAQHGLKPRSDSKLDTLNPEISIRGWCELIPCSEDAKGSILNG